MLIQFHSHNQLLSAAGQMQELHAQTLTFGITGKAPVK